MCITKGITALGLAIIVVTVVAGADKTKRPSFNAIKQTVQKQFTKQRDYQRGDIISNSEVKRALKKVEELGWKSPHAKEILKKTPEDNDFVVNLLRTKKGRKLMRKVSNERLIYDRMERTAELPGGKQLLGQLPSMRDGHKYLKVSPTPGLKNLAELLPKQKNGRTPTGKDFNKPTGRIYTLKLLLAALQKSYAWDSKRSQAVSNPKPMKNRTKKNATKKNHTNKRKTNKTVKS